MQVNGCPAATDHNPWSRRPAPPGSATAPTLRPGGQTPRSGERLSSSPIEPRAPGGAGEQRGDLRPDRDGRRRDEHRGRARTCASSGSGSPTCSVSSRASRSTPPSSRMRSRAARDSTAPRSPGSTRSRSRTCSPMPDPRSFAILPWRPGREADRADVLRHPGPGGRAVRGRSPLDPAPGAKRAKRHGLRRLQRRPGARVLLLQGGAAGERRPRGRSTRAATST